MLEVLLKALLYIYFPLPSSSSPCPPPFHPPSNQHPQSSPPSSTSPCSTSSSDPSSHPHPPPFLPLLTIIIHNAATANGKTLTTKPVNGQRSHPQPRLQPARASKLEYKTTQLPSAMPELPKRSESPRRRFIAPFAVASREETPTLVLARFRYHRQLTFVHPTRRRSTPDRAAALQTPHPGPG